MSHLLSAMVYIRDMTDFKGVSAVSDKWFSNYPAPVRACVEARVERPGILVKIWRVSAEKA